ncbi:MAG TPA: carboxypeptidase-like regulatory domain-containing protein, partial [Gemmataceae bacterium]|nr:carboxypeptidase-like regulatory domain-containing protein [Gemmataceae bacterium]
LWIITPGPAVFWVLPETHAQSTHVIKDPTKRGDVGRFVMNPGIVLKGKVLDVQGKPLAGVFVEADKRGGIEDFNLPVADHIRRTTVTNDKGEFAFAPLPAATYDVYPQERGWDPSKDEKRPQKRPLPGVFVRQQVTLKDGMPPEPKEPIEVRAVPHVVIEAQFVDSKGAKTRGHAPHLFGRMNKNDFWFGEGKMDENGKMTLLVPHGLTDSRLSLSTNEHGVLRWKKGKDGQLSAAREIVLGTLTDDVKDIEITRYVAPILIIGAVEKGGGSLKNIQAKIEYAPGRSPRDPNGMFVNGVQGDVFMEKQEDGRWRSSQLLPDEEISVTVSSEGYKPHTEKMKLAEGTTKELKAELEKSTEPEKKEAEKKYPEKK